MEELGDDDRLAPARNEKEHKNRYVGLDTKSLRGVTLTPYQQELAASGMGFAFKMAHHRLKWIFGSRRNGQAQISNHLDDCFQVACIGLIVAATKFNPDKGFTFLTYAKRVILTWITRCERMWLNDSIGPGWRKKGKSKPRGKTRYSGAKRARVFHFSDLVSDGKDACLTLDELVGDPGFDDREKLKKVMELPDVNELKRLLPPRWWDIVWNRANGMTLTQIGRKIGITKQRVRQIEQKALERLSLSQAVKNVLYDV